MKAQPDAAEPLRIVPPEILAGKIAAINNYEHPKLLEQLKAHPRFVEALWFLQAMSLRPGGLVRFAETLLAEFPERLGTATMRKIRGECSLAQKVAIINEMPEHARPCLDVGGTLAAILARSEPRELATLNASEKKTLESALAKFSSEVLRARFRKAALQKLPAYLAALCTEPSKGTEAAIEHSWREPFIETWYFDNPLQAVIELMDRHAERTKARLAMTAVTEEVFETLDRTAETRIMVVIRGTSRFGKTEALRTFCEMHPGRARFVAVPPSNCMRDLFVRIAEALGIEASYGVSAGRLGAKIAYVLRHSELFLCFDEGAWLLPQSYSRNTAPQRINWLRSELIDRGLPVAIAVTPQWYDEPLQTFVRTTKYAIEQFTGRCERVELPVELDEADLVKVAAVHFPEIKHKSDLLEIASYALTSDNYLQTIESIEKRARYMARREGRELSMEVVQRAIAKAFPKPAKAQSEAPERELKTGLTAHKRQVKPAPESREFNRCSLRAAVPELMTAEA
jgi:hypothetical protein